MPEMRGQTGEVVELPVRCGIENVALANELKSRRLTINLTGTHYLLTPQVWVSLFTPATFRKYREISQRYLAMRALLKPKYTAKSNCWGYGMHRALCMLQSRGKTHVKNH